MTENEQIQEMAKIMLEASTSANVEPVLEMEGKEVVLGENAIKILNNILEQAYIPFLAETLTESGYRKVERGKWIGRKGRGYYTCSICCCVTKNNEDEFCRHCGADMRGKKDE